MGTPDDHVKLPPIIAPRMSKADPEPEPVVPPAPGGAEKANDAVTSKVLAVVANGLAVHVIKSSVVELPTFRLKLFGRVDAIAA